MAIVSKTWLFSVDVTIDEEWANRENSGAGCSWKVTPSDGVVIHSPNERLTYISFMEEGDYKVECTISDGAMSTSKELFINVSPTNVSKITLQKDKEMNFPVFVNFPKGGTLFDKMDCIIDIDCTKSMSVGLLIFQSNIENIIKELRKYAKDIHLMIVGHGDAVDDTEEYCIETNLTGDMTEISNAINRLTATMGMNESMLKDHNGSICRSIKACNWRDNSYRLYILVGNSGDSGRQSIDNTYQMLKDNNINIIAINTWGDGSNRDPERYFWQLADVDRVKGVYIGSDINTNDVSTLISSAISNMNETFNFAFDLDIPNVISTRFVQTEATQGELYRFDIPIPSISDDVAQEYNHYDPMYNVDIKMLLGPSEDISNNTILDSFWINVKK